jgi:hypothetical protein
VVHVWQCSAAHVDRLMTLLIEGLLWAAGQIMQVARSNGTSELGIESIQE